MYKAFSAILISLLLALSSCSVTGQENNQATKPILVEVQQASELINEGGLTLIDVRTSEEVSQGYVATALHWDYFNWDGFVQNASKLDKSKPVMVYCKVGGRSGKTASYLSEQGFEKVYDIKGGMDAWKAADLPIKMD